MSRAARPTAILERELTLAVPDGVVLPDLDAVRGTRRGGVRVHDLHATYVDSPTWALLRRGLTLRRRTGGDDAGWHLKVPSSGARPGGAGGGGGAHGLVSRDEHHEPVAARSQAVPRGLRRLVTALVLDEPLGPVAVLDTHRVAVPLLDETGRRWATLTDDTVTAHRERARHGDDPEVVTWREWEVELAEGGPGEGAADEDGARLDALVAALRGAGATDSPTTSKLRRAVGDLPLPQPWTGRPRSAHELAALRVGDLVERLRAEDLRWRTADPAVRERPDGPSVHRFRTTVRRLRSLLRTYGAALDPGRHDDPHGPLAHVGAELRWLGAELGALRDAEVLRTRLHADLRAGTDEGGDPRPVVLAVTGLVDDVLGERRAVAARRVDRALASARYRALLAALDELAVPPRPEDDDAAAVRHEVARLVRRDVRRLGRAVDAAGATAPGAGRDTALHEARKKAKRLRYAADAARPVLGGRAARLSRRARAVQEALGEHQDAVVARAAVRDLLAAVPRSPRLAAPGAAARAGFLLGRLDGEQRVAARDAVAAYDVARRRLPRHPKRLLGT
ncbi:CYTH and CHAD domain-containing protein [Lapillicoccus jejuensis]|uniref:CHAD domain-containing protein n=1 Tax=Lapillicoccus jejuensis TaxID=402171 RepID=A0A542DXI2_9MICO|nr:CYTH and CHAD domain-containing protein [Lapillicoccus jejuensis]TQJ07802.1 CHAD domain-containing protein [Lapillicoccus jejuensis]